MQTITKFVTSVSDFYKDLNPSTLSGAIDIVVAERPDGVLACSPFHVRFGKMQLLRPQEKFVEFKVNETVIDIPMKLGDGGEAFFVVETDKFVPEELRTSPLALVPSEIELQTPLDELNLGKGFSSPHDAVDFDFEKELATAYPLSDSELDVRESILDMARSQRNDVVSDTEMDYSWSNKTEKKPKELRTVESRNIDIGRLKEAIEDLIQGKLQKVQISLCGQLCADRKVFDQCLVTKEGFVQNPISVLQDPQLVFCIDDKYYTWHLLAPLFVSRLVFGRDTLTDEVLQSLAVGTSMISNRARSVSPTKSVRDHSSSAPVQPIQTGGWKQWWNTRPVSPDKIAVEQDVVKSEDGQGKELAQSVHRVPQPIDIDINRPLSAPVSDQDVKNLAARQSAKQNYAKTLRLTSDQLKSLPLSYGPNNVQFSVVSSYSGNAVCTARIFLWRYDVNIVVSDIDGTITKSDALGHLLPILRLDWTHPGIANLYTNVSRNGYEILYLTSRAIGQADTTRGYLKGIEQDGQQLPDGPVIMSPDRLIAALKREVIYRRPEEFKIAVLKDIRQLFYVRNPFYAGFGNRVTDAMSYRAVDIPAYRIYSIDSRGEIKMDFFAGYSSSYVKLADLVDHIFPPIKMQRRSLSVISVDAQPGTPNSKIGRFGARNDSFASDRKFSLKANTIAEQDESIDVTDGTYAEGVSEQPVFDPDILKEGYDDFAYWRNDSFYDIPLPPHIETSKQETAIAHIKDPAQRNTVLHDLPQHSSHISKRKPSVSVSSGSSVADDDDDVSETSQESQIGEGGSLDEE